MRPDLAEHLIEQQVGLEYARDASGLLIPFSGSTEQARFIVHCHSAGHRMFFRHDLPPDTRDRLAMLSRQDVFGRPERVHDVLAPHAPCEAAFFGTSCVFVHSPVPAEYLDVVATPEGFSVSICGATAAVAWSVRENELAAELAVETENAFRRRGFGRQVAAAWAHHTIAQGKTAFYSYERDNVASRGLACSLGVVEFSTVASYD